MKNLINQKFNKLLVLELVTNEKNEKVWKCKCDCGNITYAKTNALTSGHKKSCGCSRYSKDTCQNRGNKISKNITNQRFGELIALYKLPLQQYETSYKWHCKCSCGNECDVRIGDLTSGHIKSCGCLKKKQKPLTDLVGQRFGKLIAIEPTDKRINRAVVWKCKCDCGNITYVARPLLINSYTSSCGCLKTSVGELKIEQILNKLNIPYEKQKSFTNCRLPSGYLAYFDFYINNKILLEYDGEQHFIAKECFGGEQEFLKIQQRDKFKNEWAQNNNIPLIRISYKDFNKINVDYIKKVLKQNE